MKSLIFDASTLISLAMNGLFDEVKMLKKIFNGKFLITKEVYFEIVEHPISVKRFELESLRLKELVDEGILEFPEVLNIKSEKISEKTNEIMDNTNTSFSGKGENIHLIDKGEASCLALSQMLNEKEIENVLAVDERTMRLLCEKPENLVDLLKRKLETSIKMNKEKIKLIGKCKIIRSSELVYVIWKKGIVQLNDERALDALLWAVKLKGCSISDEEIKEIEKIK